MPLWFKEPAEDGKSLNERWWARFHGGRLSLSAPLTYYGRPVEPFVSTGTDEDVICPAPSFSAFELVLLMCDVEAIKKYAIAATNVDGLTNLACYLVHEPRLVPIPARATPAMRARLEASNEARTVAASCSEMRALAAAPLLPLLTEVCAFGLLSVPGGGRALAYGVDPRMDFDGTLAAGFRKQRQRQLGSHVFLLQKRPLASAQAVARLYNLLDRWGFSTVFKGALHGYVNAETDTLGSPAHGGTTLLESALFLERSERPFVDLPDKEGAFGECRWVALIEFVLAQMKS